VSTLVDEHSFPTARCLHCGRTIEKRRFGDRNYEPDASGSDPITWRHADGYASCMGTPRATPRPGIVVLCGSSRFYDAFQQANYDLTMGGEIVLSIGFYPHSKAEHGHGEGVGHDSAEKIALDELHKRKIDVADRVLVLNVDGYIGESTRSEIAYAEAAGKPIEYLEDQP
jgi:hypothetical protein